MRVAFFGSSRGSAYYRAILRNLVELHHRIEFYEPEGELESVDRALDEARDADVVVKAAVAGALDETLESAVIDRRQPGQLVVFWDGDAAATLDRLTRNPGDPLRRLVPEYDLILTCGGGDAVTARYKSFGARECIPIYHALDPTAHHRVAPHPAFAADVAFLGDRVPDRETRFDEYFLRPASLLPHARFLLGGTGWDNKMVPPSVRLAGPVSSGDQNAFLSTPRAVLNISRESSAANGWSPAARIFEAAGAAACLITDPWEGIETFLEPQSEILVAHDGEEVAALVRDLTPERAVAIGKAALRRVLAHHTYAHRAAQLETILLSLLPARANRRWPKAG